MDLSTCMWSHYNKRRDNIKDILSPEVVLGHSHYFLPPPNKHFLREMNNIFVAHWFYRGVQDALTLWKPKYFVSETTVTTTMADFLTIFGMFAIVSTS